MHVVLMWVFESCVSQWQQETQLHCTWLSRSFISSWKNGRSCRSITYVTLHGWKQKEDGGGWMFSSLLKLGGTEGQVGSCPLVITAKLHQDTPEMKVLRTTGLLCILVLC